MPPLFVPETLSEATRTEIMEKYGADLINHRGETAQERLIASFAIAKFSHDLLATDEQRKPDSVYTHALSFASACIEKTLGQDSDPQSRLFRAAGRLCCQAVALNAYVADAKARGHVGKKQGQRLSKQVRKQTKRALEASRDSLQMFAGTAEDKKYAKRILGLSRSDLKDLEKELRTSEQHHLRKKHARSHKRRKHKKK